MQTWVRCDATYTLLLPLSGGRPGRGGFRHVVDVMSIRAMDARCNFFCRSAAVRLVNLEKSTPIFRFAQMGKVGDGVAWWSQGSGFQWRIGAAGRATYCTLAYIGV